MTGAMWQPERATLKAELVWLDDLGGGDKGAVEKDMLREKIGLGSCNPFQLAAQM